MKAVFRRALPLLLVSSMAACISGCATNGASGPVDVTRFHLQQPVARGQIAVEPFDPAGGGGIEFQAYAASVERQLARLGWTVVKTLGQSEQVALVGVRQGGRPGVRESGPVSVGVGGGTGGWGSGVGVGVGFNFGGGSGDKVGTQLEVRIKRRSDGTVFWEGRASSEVSAKSPYADPAAAVERLAEALFRDFPGESGQTIRVK